MGDYWNVPVKMATSSDPANTYFGYNDRIKNNMIAMDVRSTAYGVDDTSFNIMKTMMIMKKFATPRTYPGMRKSFIKQI